MSRSLNWGACTDVGLVRRVNEDSKCHEQPLFAVADGMGGHSAGDVASALAIETLSEQLEDAESLSDAVRAANRAIFRKASQEPELSGMGTTLTAMLTDDRSAQIAHVGDSRAYLWREEKLSRLTQDHTVVGRLVQQGRLQPEDADRHPQRSYLERALGVDSDVEVDVVVLDFKPDDRVLLCSDGLFGMIDDELIAEVLKQNADPQRAAERLCSEAVQAGGHDNVTAVIVDFGHGAVEESVPAAAGRRASTPGVRTDTGPLPGGTASVAAASPAGRQAASSPPSSPAESPDGPDRPRPKTKRRGMRALRYTSLALIVLAAGAVAALMTLRGSWYVGGSDGRVTIFSGVPGSLAGISLSEPEERTELELAGIPEPHRSRLEEGIKADSRSSAEEIVDNLSELSAQPSPAPEATPAPSPEPTPSD